MCDHDIPTPSIRPRISSTIHAIVERLPTSSQPLLTIHHTMDANSAAISAIPRVPIALSVVRTKKIQPSNSRMPATASAGDTDGNPSASQW